MNNILDLNKSELENICKDYDITELSLFGSRARKEARPNSDTDLLVRFSNDKSLLELIRLEKLLSKKLDNKVDLVTKDSTSPYIRNYILNDFIPIYGENR